MAKASLDLVVGGGGAADGKAGGGPSLVSRASGEGGGGGADLPRRADLVVSEIFGDDPLAEGAHVPWLSPPRDAAARTQHVPWLSPHHAARCALDAGVAFPGYHPSTPPGALETLRHARGVLLAPGTGVVIPEALELLSNPSLNPSLNPH